MPRIDPQQLLSCLTPLLAVNGGIKSSGEVIRLANLMQKYSKKLVSKCIYIQILKCTETDLLGQFMAANGWNLVHTWLNDSVNSANWPFVQEILEMLLLCPVDSNRLKSNHTPKIVKNLSMNISQNAMITALSKKLVEQWLKIAHQEKQMIEQQQQLQQNGINGNSNNSENTENNGLLLSKSESLDVNIENNVKIPSENNIINGIENNVDEDSSKKSSESIKYKISNNKDSGLVLSIKRSTSPTQEGDPIKSPDSKVKSEHKSKSSSSSDKDRDRKKSSSSSSHKSSSSSSSSKSSYRDKERSSSHKSSSRDKHHSSSSSKSSSSKSSSSNNSSSSSRDKDKEREKKKRDSEKEQAEKDKETLSFLTPLPSNKLQRIPKRQHSETSESESSSKNVKSSETVEKKKPSISIENRRGDKPKTVKTLNSQFRDHGLAESPPPPPSRKTLKKPANNTVILPPPTTTTAIASLSSSKPISPPPNKKIHLDKALEPDVPERAGGVKLIKPKPMLVESTGFLDALDASAFMNKKDTKKRKRLPSGSSSSTKKDEPESPKIEAKPLKFYKDTLEENADDDKEKDKMSTITEETAEIESPTKELLKDISVDIKNENKGENDEESKTDDSITVKKSPDDSSNTANAVEEEIDEKRPPGIGTGEDGPPGIIKNPNNPRKRAKRSIKWRSDEELVDIHYFPLEENERVNVTKTFMEQKHMEHIHERNALLGRRQDEQTSWRSLILIDNVPVIQYGSKSLEAKIQAEREKNTLQEVFFDGRSMSDSPQEPDFEVVDLNEPATIPLEDVTGNTDSVTSFKEVAWPAPKGDQPQFVSHGGFGNIFNNITPNITIPPAPAIALNPLAGLNLGALQPHENPALNFMGIIQQATSVAGIAPFMQPPPMIQNNYQSNNSAGNNFNNRPVNNYSTGNNNNNNNNNRNRSGSGSNWVRGNANQQLRRGMCHQYQRTGFCRNRNSGCPYIHER